jgi:hypothetical protein
MFRALIFYAITTPLLLIWAAGAAFYALMIF